MALASLSTENRFPKSQQY